MKRRLRPWAPVLMLAFGFAMLAWMVTSAQSAGHQLVTPGVPPAGVPPAALEYLPDDLIDNFPEGVDLSSDRGSDLPPELLDRLAGSLSAEELAELSNVLSDDLLAELAGREAADLSAADIQRLYDSMDPATRERLLDKLGAELSQEDVDRFEARLSDELYDELSERAETETDPGDSTHDAGPVDEPSGTVGPDDDEPSASSAEPSETQESPTDEAAEDEPWQAPDWLTTLGDWLVVALKWLLIAGSVGLAGYLLYRVITSLTGRNTRAAVKRREKPTPQPPQPEVEKLREAVQEGIIDIDGAADPRRGVIACWQRMERAAAAAGLARLESETPGELVARVMAAAEVDSDALTGLADAYRRARYAPHEIAEDLRQQAKAALAEVDAQLAAAHSRQNREPA